MKHGYIRPNKSPYGLPILFMDKKDNKLHMCIDYHALNKITIKNNYSVPRIDNIFDHLNEVFYFSYINLKLGSYHIHVENANVEKTAMKTRYNSYELLVMPFGLCNILHTFITLMNSIFHDKLNEFMIIYIDDILVYSKSIEKYATHLEFVLQKFNENKLYVDWAKNEFASLEMEVLGCVIPGRGEAQPKEN
jgi:hypothetical protein